MQTGKVFAAFDGASGGRRLAGLCEDMLAGQLLDWPRLREGYKGLAAAKVRNIPCEGFTLKAQWNPQRIVSTGASLDPAAIRARPCFLCRNNLPDAQRALDYRKHYLILCNPAPIFERHFTVANVQHRPQSIAPALDVFLTLIRDFSPEFQVFYNGPKSGASAPDHLHFQAAPAGVLPVEADIRAGQKMRLHKTMDGVELLEAAGMGRAILVLKGPDSASVAAALLRVMAALRAVLNADGEPMMNLLGSYGEGRWRILIFPRRKHRPSVFDLEGEAQVLITPASVEMGGLFITPREKDFRSLDALAATTIFQEVSIDERMLARVVKVL